MSRPLRLGPPQSEDAGVRSCILYIFFFKLWLFYSYLVYETYNAYRSGGYTQKQIGVSFWLTLFSNKWLCCKI
jgi:hypothetical protein